MDQTLLDKFRDQLQQQRQELQDLESTGDEAAATVELDQTRVGRLSRMDALQGQAMSRESRQRRQQLLTRITAALRRIDDGDFGYCLQCDKEIALQRLEFDPAVRLCIDCASKAES